MNDMIDQEWLAIFSDNDLDQFEDFWSLDIDWVEKPNQRRGGWSGVSRLNLVDADGEEKQAYLKRQCNHNCRSWRHPFKGEPTFRREMKNILRYAKDGIATLTPIYYADRSSKKGDCAIIITEALDEYMPLNDYVDQNFIKVAHRFQDRIALIQVLADFIATIHKKHYRHCCMYAKHLFIKASPEFEVRIIDLEKARKWYFPENRLLRDLTSLYRSLDYLSLRDRLRFLKFYLNKSKLDKSDRRLIAKLERRYRKKLK